MKMTLLDVINKQKSLVALADKRLPYRLAYAISKNIVKLHAEAEIIEKGRKDLIDEYVVKSESGEPVIEENQYKIKEEKVEEFNTEFDNYMSMETDVKIMTIGGASIEATMDSDKYDALTPAELIALDFMIEKLEEKADGK